MTDSGFQLGKNTICRGARLCALQASRTDLHLTTAEKIPPTPLGKGGYISSSVVLVAWYRDEFRWRVLSFIYKQLIESNYQ